MDGPNRSNDSINSTVHHSDLFRQIYFKQSRQKNNYKNCRNNVHINGHINDYITLFLLEHAANSPHLWILSKKGLNKALRLKTLALLREGKRENLQRIGLVLHTSSSGNMILKAENIPRIGDQVMDENLKAIGKIFDVFGPVSSPYVAVRPNVEEPNRFIQRVLYVAPSSKPRREKRRR